MERITAAAVAAARRHFERRTGSVRAMIVAVAATGAAEDAKAAMLAGFLELAAIWTPDALAALLRQAMELAALEGREAVFAEIDDDAAFAEPDFTRQEFREQIDFLTQKRVKPTRVWTDAMLGDHDRAFVVAGVTDLAMLEEFQQAIIAGARTYDVGGFAAEFDRLVDKYGWSYKGGREWRIRTIFETNIRTSYMAGRLRQMRDPDVVKLRPYWQYWHGETRQPVNPRPQHVFWDKMVLRWDDPWWDTFFPPNDWLCSCGVRTLSAGDLRRMGKTGPDQAPKVPMRNVLDRTTGETARVPQGVGLGWDYMPGDRWDRGLVPSAIFDDPEAQLDQDAKGRLIVKVDKPEPFADLLAKARPQQAAALPPDLPMEDYARAFLTPFGADVDRPVLWQDATGTRILISDTLFRERSGVWKAAKRGHGDHAAILAETMSDPDEVWLNVRALPDPVRPELVEYHIVRRYIRADPETAAFSLFELGRVFWSGVTGYGSYQRTRPDFRHLDVQRRGKLLWKRK